MSLGGYVWFGKGALFQVMPLWGYVWFGKGALFQVMSLEGYVWFGKGALFQVMPSPAKKTSLCLAVGALIRHQE
jgi:hypothetical protein